MIPHLTVYGVDDAMAVVLRVRLGVLGFSGHEVLNLTRGNSKVLSLHRRAGAGLLSPRTTPFRPAIFPSIDGSHGGAATALRVNRRNSTIRAGATPEPSALSGLKQ